MAPVFRYFAVSITYGVKLEKRSENGKSDHGLFIVDTFMFL